MNTYPSIGYICSGLHLRHAMMYVWSNYIVDCKRLLNRFVSKVCLNDTHSNTRTVIYLFVHQFLFVLGIVLILAVKQVGYISISLFLIFNKPMWLFEEKKFPTFYINVWIYYYILILNWVFFWFFFVDACGGYIDLSNGTIQSPSFPDLYPPNKNCVWQIVAPDQYRITLNLTHFDMEGNNVSTHSLVMFLILYAWFPAKPASFAAWKGKKTLVVLPVWYLQIIKFSVSREKKWNIFT